MTSTTTPARQVPGARRATAGAHVAHRTGTGDDHAGWRRRGREVSHHPAAPIDTAAGHGDRLARLVDAVVAGTGVRRQARGCGKRRARVVEGREDGGRRQRRQRAVPPGAHGAHRANRQVEQRTAGDGEQGHRDQRFDQGEATCVGSDAAPSATSWPASPAGATTCTPHAGRVEAPSGARGAGHTRGAARAWVAGTALRRAWSARGIGQPHGRWQARDRPGRRGGAGVGNRLAQAGNHLAHACRISGVRPSSR